METINLGRVAFVYKGDYSAVTTYNKMDVVFDGESSFVSQIDNNVGNPLVNGLNWKYLSRGNNLELQEAKQDIATLETDLNQTDIKNAEQDASIKSIEQLLSQSNLNQTAQVSSTGREIISLPKTASNGGMDVKLEGLTAQNLVVNGDFRNGMYKWSSTYGMGSVNGNIFTVEVVTPSEANRINQEIGDVIIGEKVYVKYSIKPKYSTMTRIQIGNTSNSITPAENVWNIHSAIILLGGVGDKNLRLYHDTGNKYSVGDTIQYKDIFYINLTSSFGAGNEPDLATCDAMFSSYFDSTKSFIPTGRVRSVGKNTFDIYSFLSSLGTNYAELVSDNGVQAYKLKALLSSKSIKLPLTFKPNTQYSMRMRLKQYDSDGTYSGIYFQVYYTDASFSSFGYGNVNSGYLDLTITSTLGKSIDYIRFTNSHWQSDSFLAIGTFQIEKSSIATTFEPYHDTKLYLTALELKSNGLIKDEVRKGANYYEHVKRIGVGTLGTELITNAADRDFSADTGWWSKGLGVITDGKYSINVSGTEPVFDRMLRRNNDFLVRNKTYLLKLECQITSGSVYFRTNNSNLFIYASTYNIVNGTNYITFRLPADISYNASVGFLFTGIATIDNVSIKEIIPQDGILTDTKVSQNGDLVYWSLSTPVITPIEHAGILNSAEGGTVYHEPVMADAGIYSTNLTVLNTTYSISSLEEIMVHTNVDTYLDVSKAVIASDGLSFTHPDLRAGDLVLFTYFFSKEKVNGLITATYYDGRYVIADTANGKFYKWGVKSTNGVATIQLTEV